MQADSEEPASVLPGGAVGPWKQLTKSTTEYRAYAFLLLCLFLPMSTVFFLLPMAEGEDPRYLSAAARFLLFGCVALIPLIQIARRQRGGRAYAIGDGHVWMRGAGSASWDHALTLSDLTYVHLESDVVTGGVRIQLATHHGYEEVGPLSARDADSLVNAACAQAGAPESVRIEDLRRTGEWLGSG